MKEDDSLITICLVAGALTSEVGVPGLIPPLLNVEKGCELNISPHRYLR